MSANTPSSHPARACRHPSTSPPPRRDAWRPPRRAPATADELNWPSIASSILERMERPALLVARDGSVLARNSAFEGLLGAGRERTGRLSWRDLFTDAPETAEAALSATDSPHELRLLSGRVFESRLWLTLQLAPAAGDADAPVLVQVMQVSRIDAAPRQAVAIESYVVSASRHSLGKLLATGHGPRTQAPATSSYCYEAIYGSSTPCVGCPVFEAADRLPRRSTIPPGRGSEHYRVVEVAALHDERLKVRSVFVSNNVLSELLQAKVEWIAHEGGLSAREAEVLNLLYVGRSTRDIAMLLAISERTVKYHQANVLRKLGADSRADLVRLLL